VCLIVMGRHIPQMQFLHILLGDDAELSPEAHFYERLLAMDQPEAHAIAERFLKGHTLVELYDGVVLPALILTEQDRHKGVLDEVRSTWLYQSAAELIAELTEYTSPYSPEPASAPENLRDHSSPVVCIPGGDEADEIAGTMLAQLLEQCGHRAILLSPSAMAPEILARLGEDANTILCISAVPPFAFAQARRVAQTLRQSLPRNPILVGLWGNQDDMEVLRGRFGSAHPNAVVATLEDALEQVRQIDSLPVVEAVS
jgi:hypothetical protein